VGEALGGNFPPNPSRKTATVSYRIREELKANLEEEAARLGINPNALVSQIFSRHVSWGRYVGRLNFVPVSKDFLRFVFETLSQDDIGRIARALGESQAHEELLFLFQQITPGTILMFIDLWASHFDAWDHKYQGGKHLFTIKHDVNLNFSFFTKEYVSSLLQSTLGTKVDFEAMSPNSVTFSFGSTLNHWRNDEVKPAPNRLNNNIPNQTLQKKTA
jgi:hypothetical protein